jgi:hypothetical protein
VKHLGDVVPVPADTLVRAYLAPDDSHVGLASEFTWGPGLGPDGEGRIVAYDVLGETDAR